ncbi:MAG: nitroreductase family protein [Thermoproteota archaeon]|nr:MAG: nitroreductase family protein [Candidatus Korarchaeota archaeon]
MRESSVLELARRRKTVRKFLSDPVSLMDVLLALEAACQAPSGANAQPWRFVIVTDPNKKRRIREECEKGERKFYSKVRGELKEWLLSKGFSWKKPFLEEAPILVLVFSEKRAPHSTRSVWLAIGYILLALEELGLGTVTYTPSDPKGVLDEVKAPKENRLEAILPIGVSADEKLKEPRLGVKEVSFLNYWENPIS